MRRRLSLALVLGLLLAQWAVAGYVCPRAWPAADAADAAEPLGMPGCAGMTPWVFDPAQPQLCKAHCEQGGQSVNVTPNPEPATAYSVVAVLDWLPSVSQPAPGVRWAGFDSAAAAPPPGWPPIYLILRALRD